LNSITSAKNNYFVKGNLEDIRPHLYEAKKVEKDVLKKLIQSVEKYQSVPYRYGGCSVKGVDCSGFVKMIYQEFFNINVPHGSRNQVHYGHKVDKDDLRPGDLLFFKMGSRIGHVGIYLADGFFVSAESMRGIGICHINSIYWQKKYVTAKRLLNLSVPKSLQYRKIKS